MKVVWLLIDHLFAANELLPRAIATYDLSGEIVA